MTADDHTRTSPPDATREQSDAALDAGLAAAFGDLTPGGFTLPPLLRDDPSDQTFVKPSSAKMPKAAAQRYQLHGEIARGGMGVVLKGRDPDLGRDLAFKVLRGELAGKPAAVQRFVEEAQIGGQLQHPGVVPVYDLGRFADGRPYFAMKLVKGRTLADLFAARKSPADDRGRLLHVFLQVCQTVAYAHAKGVIHRDLKPSNVMVGGFGEVLVMDWGLAKVLPRGGIADEEKAIQASRERERPEDGPTEIKTARSGSGSGSETQAGSVMGTPAFMPPEQAGGEVDKLDERADVFGLGAMLCVLLTGQPPYVAGTSDEVRLMAVRGKLADAHARLDACGADAELVGLCKRCLSAERDDRPRHAGEIVTAISSHLAEVEQRARRAEVERAAAAAEAKEQRKRRRVQAALGIVFTTLVVLGGVVAWWAHDLRRDRREKAEREVNRAVEAAVAKYAQARGADRNLALWAEARAAALQADSQAVAADAPAGVQDRVRDLLAEIEQVEKNRRLVATLLDIQAGRGDTIVDTGQEDFAAADARYEQAFREYGADPFALTPDGAAEVLSGLGQEVRVELAAAIDDWAYIQRFLFRFPVADRMDRTAHLMRVTRLFDPDPLRNQLRHAILAQDHATLARLSEEIDPSAHPVQTVNLVAVYLYNFRGKLGGYSPAIRFLSRVQLHHPGDFQINHNLAFILIANRQDAAAIPYSLAAIAVRPTSATAWKDYVHALGNLSFSDPNRVPETAAACRRLVGLAPNYMTGQTLLARSVALQGRPAEALTLFTDAMHRNPNWVDPKTGVLRPGSQYNTACTAVVIGAAVGSDALPAGARSQLRQQALGWLRADLAVIKGRASTYGPAVARGQTRHWLSDPDLASVRDPSELTKLPPDERVAWEQLWAEVRKLHDDSKPEVLPPPRADE